MKREMMKVYIGSLIGGTLSGIIGWEVAGPVGALTFATAGWLLGFNIGLWND